MGGKRSFITEGRLRSTTKVIAAPLDFRADEGFFVLGPTVHSGVDGDLSFYHSGFEWAGGEDRFLSIRWGRCKKS